MSKPTITIQETSMRGYSLFVLHEAGDKGHMPAVSTTMPTHIAKWLKFCADAHDEIQPSDFIKMCNCTGKGNGPHAKGACPYQAA